MTYTVLVHSTDETYEGEGYDRWMWSRIEYRAMYDHILSDLRGLSPDRAHLINSVQVSRAMALELSKYNCDKETNTIITLLLFCHLVIIIHHCDFSNS